MRLKIGFLLVCAYIGLCIGSCLTGLTGCGIRGEDGKPGYTGAVGQTGAPGKDASSCTVTQAEGGVTVSCPDGSTATVHDGIAGTNGADGAPGQSGSNGSDGQNGADGQNGTNGVNGTNGQDGTMVTMVQFCPGATVYPTSFPEYGICIQNQIYAVYWMQGNAWLAAVPPGAYSSTSSSVACSFTVGANCAVSYE